MSRLGTRLIRAAKEARAIVRGEKITDGFVVHVPDEVDIKALRKRRGRQARAGTR
jgi:putative transcriptional regulator